MCHFSKNVLIIFSLLLCFHNRCPAQSYDPFGGHAEAFHANLQRYFKDAEDEIGQRKQLLKDVDSFIADSTWTVTNLPKYFDRYEVLFARLKKHQQYFRLCGYINNKDTTARQNKGLISGSLGVLDDFFSGKMQSKNLQVLTAGKMEMPGISKYAYLINAFRKTAAHDVSPDNEALIDKLGVSMLDRLTDRYDELMDEITAPDIITSDGKKLNAIFDRNRILKSNDASIRRAGTIAFNGSYSSHGEVLAATLIDIAADKTAIAKLRDYKSAPERSYLGKLQLSESSVKELLSEMMKHADVLKAYQKLQADHTRKLSGLEKVSSYDLSSMGNYTWQPGHYNGTRQLILKALAPLGKDYNAEFAWLLDPGNGALEIAGGLNRVNENTSVGYPGTPVTLYMKNYNGALGDVLRLSHEGGHAVHMKLMNDLKVPSYASGPSFLFEAFAMLNELLVLDELQKQALTKEAKIFYAQQFINKLAYELFTSAQEGAFEQELYDGVAGGKIKNRNDVDTLYAGIMNQYDLFFPGEPERKSEWINKRLLFDDPLYNINYLYAMLVTCKLYDLLHQDPKTFAGHYRALLMNGFDNNAEDLLVKFMGFKLDHQALLSSALKLMQRRSGELARLYQ